MKILWIILSVVMLLAVAGVGIGFWTVKRWTSPDFVAKRLEKRWNCRAEVEAVEAGGLGTSRMIVRGLALAPRDEIVESGVPHAARLPLEEAPIRAATIELRMLPFGLLTRRLDVEELAINDLVVAVALAPDGSTELEDMFGAVEGTDATPSGSGKATAKQAAPREGAFSAGSMPFTLAAGKVGLNNARFRLDVESSGARIELTEADFVFSDLDVDPDDLANRNRANFDYTGRIVIGAPGEEKKGLDAVARGTGFVAPFDRETRRWSPAWRSEVHIAQGARIDTFPVVEKIRERLRALDQAGINFSELWTEGTLQSDATTLLSYTRGRYQFESPFLLEFPKTAIQVHEASWIDVARNVHEIRGEIIPSADFTTDLVQSAEQRLAQASGGRVPPEIVSAMVGPLLQDGKLVIQLVSQGDLKQPRVDIATPVGNLGSLLDGGSKGLDGLREMGRGLLRGFLNR